MDAAQALADLTEISTQIEAAVVVDARGKVAASTLDDERSQRVAAAARQLLDAADQLGSDNGAIAQIDAATPEGSVFVVRHGEYLIAATTGPEPTVGLVFYDLKSCLRSLAEQEESAAPQKPKRAPRKAAPRKPAATKKKSDAES
jgi:predicted regulator of Ras-like GTPase activity (Roadblock/LC7/MglB family)